MGQVGHADSTMTTDVYAQLQQRVRREHGNAFDLLVRQARERLYGRNPQLDEAPEMPPIGRLLGHERAKSLSRTFVDDWREEAETPDCRAFVMARPGLEPGTPRFQAADEVARSPEKSCKSVGSRSAGSGRSPWFRGVPGGLWTWAESPRPFDRQRCWSPPPLDFARRRRALFKRPRPAGSRASYDRLMRVRAANRATSTNPAHCSELWPWCMWAGTPMWRRSSACASSSVRAWLPRM